MNETYAQRMRVWFVTDDTVKYVGHLDMHRAWERAIRRARLPLAYTQGFNPQPRLQFAAALPVGFTGRGEVADVFLNEELAPSDFVQRLGDALPPGIRPFRAEPVPRELPSLQSQVNGARYRVEVETDDDEENFTERLAEFLARPEAWRERRKGKEISRYDLRPLIQDLRYTGRTPYGHSFEVSMRAEPGATGRPDELLAELGYENAPRRIVRQALLFA
ncbi:MAG: TIGR03936 family radical SAM-associated protein [Nitrososphaerales archaeon]